MMCMFNTDFKKMISSCLKEALQAENLETSLEKTSNKIASFYRTQSCGLQKAMAKGGNISPGSGRDSLTQWERIEYQKGYAVFLQNFSSVPKQRKGRINRPFQDDYHHPKIINSGGARHRRNFCRKHTTRPSLSCI